MKLDFKSLSAVILGVLGLSEWSKVEDKNSITAEEMTKLKNYGFSDKFLTAFKASSRTTSRTKPEPGMRERETKNLPLPLFFAVCWVILRPVWHRHRNSLKLCRRNSVTKPEQHLADCQEGCRDNEAIRYYRPTFSRCGR